MRVDVCGGIKECGGVGSTSVGGRERKREQGKSLVSGVYIVKSVVLVFGGGSELNVVDAVEEVGS